MINLLPPEDKRLIRAGKANILLVRYCVISLLLAVPLFLLIGGTYFIMHSARETAQTDIQERTERTAEYKHIQAEADTFSKNLQTAKSILDDEVKYSRIAVKIAQALPDGITLDALQLNESSFGTPITLNATGKNYDDALRLKTAFERSELFSDPHLQQVTLQGEGNEQNVSIAISVVIAPEITKS